ESDRDDGIAMTQIDPVDLEVVKASLSGIVQEMQNSLFRTGFSTIVRESQDASCALMNDKGEIIAQHVLPPLHIGAFPACTRGGLGACRRAEERLGELLAKYGKGKVLACCERRFALGEARVGAAVAEWADGRYEAERFIDEDGVELNKPVRIHVIGEKKGEGL